ncbi:TldD/PmbA family protein [Undibacterium sp.]|jgi:predicted Zn-dependent protease|uniref:TldD/PmbA family protein n=1 Tax=Undibacterium sp. TaxID=1914977 RepID=UPI002B80410A|nr:metallopeptidase TldD-related protein [Undibacterium sp.]HTD02647.1 metallopeptidase TldD-related protein [Undibacterium sp.]
MQEFFHQIAERIETLLQQGERSTCWFSAESSDFVRFNRSAIRQPGHVMQRLLSVNLIHGARHANTSLTLSGKLEEDSSMLADAIAQLRLQLPDLPEDPHLLIATDVQNTTRILPSNAASTDRMVDQILEAAKGRDMVGILIAGSLYRGFANSLGQRNWYETANFNFDWSLFHAADKAVKSNYAGFAWDAAVFTRKFDEAVERLSLLAIPPVTVAPGNYRVYLTPTALNELIGMLNWGGLAEKSLRTHQSPLRRMRTGDASLAASVNLSEDSGTGLAPGFQAKGFIKPQAEALIRQGKLVGSMVSPRTAKEYGLSSNGADDDETANAMVMQPGSLPMEQVLAELGTGIFVSNLWYLNFSDRANCRITGMTRFATFWVEDGKIKAPLNVMRFDDSLFRILGDNLLALTQETEVIMDDRSYGERHTGGAILPGALVKEMTFVL